MASEHIEVTQIDGGSKLLERDSLDRLEERFDGRILLSRDAADWSDAIGIWNGMVAKVPAVVVQPSSAADVVAVVDFVRDEGLLVSVKGGGHNIAGTAIADGGITLDMSHMGSVSVDLDRRIAKVGPGCLLGDVDAATQEHGLATPLGFVSETGVAGLTLGGGWGYLTRRFGWTVDNLEAVEIVTADGVVRTANRQENADLHWAVRGGGGNFGVATRFEFRLHEVGPLVTGGLIAWSAEKADEVLEVYRDLTSTAPRELTAALIIRLAPPAPFIPEEWHGRPIIGMLICYSGDDPETALAPVRSLEDPIADLVDSRPYTVQQSLLDGTEPDGLHRYWKTEFLPELSPGFLDTFSDAALEVKSPLSDSVIFHLGGALNERSSDDGAIGNRDAQFIAGFSGTWPPDAPAETHIDWVRRLWERIRDYSTGGNYVNF
ncbi:MAG TPA: FAD-binding oxidoreductase [Thermoleophilia bacterium]|nr:FAD-binding oxidoreductase [Thermoleophilia bacterium]